MGISKEQLEQQCIAIRRSPQKVASARSKDCLILKIGKFYAEQEPTPEMHIPLFLKIISELAKWHINPKLISITSLYYRIQYIFLARVPNLAPLQMQHIFLARVPNLAPLQIQHISLARVPNLRTYTNSLLFSQKQAIAVSEV